MKPVRFRLNLRKVEADADKLIADLKKMKKGLTALNAKAASVKRTGDQLRAAVERAIRAVPRG